MQPPVLPAVLLVTVGLWLPIAMCEVTFPTVGDASLTNVQFYNNTVYLAGNSKVYALTGDLSQTLQEVDTCFGNSNCDNVNKILLVNKHTNQILTCGTDTTNDTCQIRPLGDLAIINETSARLKSEAPKVIMLTNSTSRLPVGLITSTGYLHTGITLGPDLVVATDPSSGTDYFFFLSSRKFYNLEYENDKKITLKSVYIKTYTIYFKSVFEDNFFTYFLTNQKMTVNGEHYVSKIIRLCQNDTMFRSYTDVPIECSSNEGTYNLAQGASLFEPGLELRRSLNLSAGDKVLAVTFTNDTDPDSPSPEHSSAVCLYSLQHVNERIMAAKKNDITCSTSSLNDSDRYLERNNNPWGEEKICHPPEDQVTYDERNMICPTDLYYFYLAGTYNERVSSTSVYSTTEADITRVLGSAVLGTTFTHLYLGTSQGQLIMVNVNSPDGHVYSSLDVDQGHPVLDIHEEDDSYYVMSERKLVRYEMTDCSEYSSCETVMKSRNPHCGWCIYSSRSTVNTSCSNHWLSALGDCVTIHLNPKGAAINTGTNVIVHASSNLPENVTGDTYFCRFVNTTIPDVIAEKTSSTTFLCTVPDTVGAQTYAKLQLFIKHQQDDIRLAETDFLFFDCSYYKRCGTCVGDEGSDCEWCTASTRCQPTNQTCNQSVSKQVDACPRLENTGQHYLPADVNTTLQLAAANIDTSLSYVCHIDGQYIQAKPVSVSSIECPVKVSFEEEDTEKKYLISVTYGTEEVPLEKGQQNTVTVYKCEFESNSMRRDCSQCGALNPTIYSCHWCAGSRGCGYSKGCVEKICPPPTITKVLPLSTTLNGTTLITITGTELGSHVDDITDIKIGGITCHKNDTNGFIVSKRVVCRAVPSNNVMVNQTVTVTVDNQSGSSDNIFSYLDPSPTGITPTSGPVAGGTRLTITGEHLGVGSRQVQVKLGSDNCLNARVEPNVPVDVYVREPFEIHCETVNSTEEKYTEVQVVFDGTTKTVPINYNYIKNPTIAGVTPRKAIAIGGTRITVTGEDMNNAHDAHITITDRGEKTKASCAERTDKQIVCKTPPLTEYLKNQLSSVSSVRRKRATSCGGSECILVPITVRLDGVHQSFADVQYFPDPQFDMLEEGGGVRSHSTDNQYLTITGKNLDLVATSADISITIGVDICAIVTLTATNVTCSAPKQQPRSDLYGKEKAEVNVTVGNLKATVGYLVYQEETDNAVIIGAACGGAVALIVIVVLIVGFVKYRRIGKTAEKFKQTLIELESAITIVVREEFADMHTSMAMVSTKLVEQGFPYHEYHRYAFNVMFPADFIENHPLMQEVAVSDDVRAKMKSGLQLFENLVYNKFFLISVISTMEKQKKFFLKDKSSMAGNITALMLTRMDYMQEILNVLLTNLVNRTDKKAQKTIFRRCESITEKLLHNWLSLCLYPHIKSHSGSPLYLLYKATQITMESGPIDAVTHDAKYTLCEEKLLKNYSQQARDGSNDPTFEAKSLTLNVVVDNSAEVQVCKVLDCDTVNQVKQKCLSQIYVNYPASLLAVGPADLILQWHAGFSGCLNLRDEDNTSKREGEWIRVNTLAHYNVQDGSNMALVDPQSPDNQQQVYENLAQVHQEHNATGNQSFDSCDPLTASGARSDDEDPADVKKWHIVRPEGVSHKQNAAIDDLYLNRLLTTKQSILEYVKALFDTVLSEDSVPPPVKFLFDFLDEIAETAKVEPETVHLWKSHSYPIRVWASFIRKPAIMFDLNCPSYVETSMDILGQVFIESFNVASHKLTKDSPASKLIFNNEVELYRERVLQFYKGVQDNPQKAGALQEYLYDLNKMQGQSTRFSKTSALYRFYQQLEPYMSDIIDDLANSREASSLQLGRKLEQVISTLEDAR